MAVEEDENLESKSPSIVAAEEDESLESKSPRIVAVEEDENLDSRSASIGAAEEDENLESKSHRIAAAEEDENLDDEEDGMMFEDDDMHEDSYEWEASQITPSLHLGGLQSALSTDAATARGITHLLSVLAVDDFTEVEQAWVDAAIEAATTNTGAKTPSIKCVGIRDAANEDLLAVLPGAVAFLHDAIGSGGCVLVHCLQGVSRSTSVVVAYLIRHHNMSLREAVTHVRHNRPGAEPNRGFWRQLRAWETAVRQGVTSYTDAELPGTVYFEKAALAEISKRFHDTYVSAGYFASESAAIDSSAFSTGAEQAQETACRRPKRNLDVPGDADQSAKRLSSSSAMDADSNEFGFESIETGITVPPVTGTPTTTPAASTPTATPQALPVPPAGASPPATEATAASATTATGAQGTESLTAFMTSDDRAAQWIKDNGHTASPVVLRCFARLGPLAKAAVQALQVPSAPSSSA